MVEPSPAAGRVASLNVGLPRTVEWQGRAVTTGIFKSPVTGPVRLVGDNLDGDRQADLTVHGGADKAVYAYAAEDTTWWEATLGTPLGPGAFGENLTTTGLDVTGAVIGERWRIGDAVLEVAQPRYPCAKLGLRLGDAMFPGTFERAHRPGAYLRILVHGTVRAGEAVTVVDRPAHGLTIGEVSRAEKDLDEALLVRMLAAPELPERRRAAAVRLLSHLRSPDGR